jgi:hypothetical protein
MNEERRRKEEKRRRREFDIFFCSSVSLMVEKLFLTGIIVNSSE